jgi:hypothetical protein
VIIPDRILRQYLAGALEPPVQERVERALRREPGLRERLAVLLATSIPEPEADVGWLIPPPNLPRSLRATTALAAVMGEQTEGWVEVWLEIPKAHLDDRVIVLERESTGWRVVFPTEPAELVSARALPRDGARSRLDLDARSSRIAVVLVAPDRPLDLTLPEPARWAELRACLEAGEVPITSIDILAEAP